MTVDSAEVALDLFEVSKVYPAAVPVHALRSATIRVLRGDSVGVTGRSGSGKSTLLNVLGLLDRPSSGRYSVAGVATETLPGRDLAGLRATVFGFVFQHFQLLADRTAQENVELGMLYQMSRRRDRELRARDALDRVGLSHRRESFPSKLSGGEAQRVAIARSVAARPQVLLCDEPTGNLDETTAGEILELLLGLVDRDLTLILVTHDPSVAGRMSRRLNVVDGLISEITSE